MALHCVVASDFHLDGMQKVLQNPLPYQIKEIDKVYDYAIANSIGHFIMPGDLCHTPSMSDDTLLAVITLLLKREGSGVETRYIAGNHDVESLHKSSLDILAAIAEAGFFKAFHVYKQPAVKKIDGIQVAFMPFPHTVVPECSKPPLVFAHIETPGALGDNGRPLRGGHDDDFKRQPGDFVVSGHLHQYQYLKSKRIVYCGTPYQTNFGESLPKGFLDLKARYVNGNLKVTFEHIDQRPNFVLETRVISEDQDWEKLSTETNVRYKVLVEEGLVVPRKIADQLKNIVSITGISSKIKVSTEGVSDALGVTTANSLPSFKITTGLKHYIKLAGHDGKQLKRAQTLAREAAQHLGLYR